MNDKMTPEHKALKLVKQHQDKGLDEGQALEAALISAGLGIELTRRRYWYDVREVLNRAKVAGPGQRL